MLFKRHNLPRVICVQLIQRGFNAPVGNARHVWRIGKTPSAFDDNVNKTISNFDLWRNVQKFAQTIHTDPLLKKLDRFSFEGGLTCKPLQSFNFTIGCKA